MGSLTQYSGLPFPSVRRSLLGLMCLATAACSESGQDLLSSQTLKLDAECDVSLTCTGRSDAVTVSVSMTPQRMALEPFRIELLSDANAVDVSVSLKMQDMDMGQNRYRLLRTDKGTWQAEIILPLCASARSDWVAVFNLYTPNKLYRLSVPFTLDK